MLDINPMAVLTQAIAFICLVGFMAAFVFRPVSAMIDTRQREIQNTLDQIAQDRKAMERTRSDYEQRLANIEAQAQERIATAVNQAKEEAAEIRAKANADASEQRARALAEIDQERKKAVAQIRSEMADLAVIAAGKILERELNPATHRELIKDFIQEVGVAS